LDIPLEKIQKDASVVLENIFFATNKSTLEKASGVELQKLVKYMASNATLRIRIEGHTDSDGDEAANMKLSQERSESVRSYLISNGIAADRIEAQGFGETQPIAPNTTPEGKAKNRRTAFRVI
jgi:outer membrane protein OmpA-like peptidoglycan-associated protein